MKQLIKRIRIFISRCRSRYHSYKKYKAFTSPIKKAFKHKKFCFLVLTPEHGNLGDHAIALSEKLMLQKLGVYYYELSGYDLDYLQSINRLSIMNGRPIIVNGGGNLGTLWFRVEQQFREIIQSNPKSQIILMPNTIYYDNSSFGEKELENSIRVYNSHAGLYLFAREKTSYLQMREIYNNVELVPDMVLALEKQTPKEKRSGCLLCLRKDIEKTLTSEEKTILKDAVTLLFKDNEDIDTVVDHDIPFEFREKELDFIWKCFRSSQLVITDRLHGMIFAAITETPCIVLNSKSPKVKGCYEWIKNLGYIDFCEDINDIPEVYKKISNIKCKYDSSIFSPYYKKLEDLIESVVK